VSNNWGLKLLFFKDKGPKVLFFKDRGPKLLFFCWGLTVHLSLESILT
jgi:hypothetical protein